MKYSLNSNNFFEVLESNPDKEILLFIKNSDDELSTKVNII